MTPFHELFVVFLVFDITLSLATSVRPYQLLMTSLHKRLLATLPAALLLLGGVFQGYMLYFVFFLAIDTTFVHYVAGNELMLVWAALAAIPLQWASIHMAAKAYLWDPHTVSRGGPRTSINWLPVGTRLQIVLWTGYIAVSLALSSCTSFLLLRLQLSSCFAVLVLTYAMPLAASVLALPPFARKLLGRLQCRHEQEQHIPDTIALPKSPEGLGHELLNASLPSDMSQSTRSSPRTVVGNDSCLQLSGPQEQFDPVSPISSTQSQAVADSMITLTNSHTPNLFLPFRRIANTVARILLNVVTYSPLAVLAALGSISIYAMILYSALNQYRNLFSAPLNLPSLAQTTAIYADGSTHPVNLSISCKGALPPELRARSADALPQQATILIEHMRGFPALVVRSIQDALVEQDRRVCVYDRPGYMLSPQGYAPLPIDALERALGVALAGIGERGPYYLIGHRSGSENAQLFERESRQSVVGMTLLNPTDTALLGLTSGAVDEPRRRTAVSAVIGDSVVAENTYSSTALNIQRMLAAVGIRFDSALTDTSTDDQIVAEWALANTHLAQAQYYESLQRQAVVDQLSGTGIAGVYPRKKLPVMLLGLDANETTYRNFLDYVDDRYKVEIPNGGGSQPLPPTTLLARQIIWHIARIN